jgi:molecular chaperone IbpA
VEFATLEWVDWFNTRRLLEPIGHVPPAEAAKAGYAALEASPLLRMLFASCKPLFAFAILPLTAGRVATISSAVGCLKLGSDLVQRVSAPDRAPLVFTLLDGGCVMRTYDFSPLYRSTVGFDRLFDMLEGATRVEPMTNYPPYNIEKAGEDQYRIIMAVAGFTPDEIELTQHETTLIVVGNKHAEPEGTQVLHRGIATRAFKQTFNLADHVKVVGANLVNGLLTVELKREVPEALKPRRIEIAATDGGKALAGKESKQIEHEAKAA